MASPVTVRSANAADPSEIELIASRMRMTLIEVLGEERGSSMYSLEWLVDRVRQHLDQVEFAACVFVAELPTGELVGHSIVRVDLSEGPDTGLFSTTYVSPEWRGSGIAKALLTAGEKWMTNQNLSVAATYTAPWNTGLRRLFEGRGYACMPINEEFVRLSKSLLREANCDGTVS